VSICRFYRSKFEGWTPQETAPFLPVRSCPEGNTMLSKNLKVALPLVLAAIAVAIFFAWQARRFSEMPVASSNTAAQTLSVGLEESSTLASGTIQVVPALADRSKQIGIIYVMIRSAAGGPPYAVSRIENPRSGENIPFALTTKNVMAPGVPLPADARLIVRFDADGSAGPEAAGDLVGETLVEALGRSDLTVRVDREGGHSPQ
jgi:hypothetical protein